MRRVGRAVMTAVTGGALAASCLLGASSAIAAPTKITIWADAAHAEILSKLLAKGYKGTPVDVVTKDLADIRASVATVPKGEAPDVIWGDQSWTGELAANGTIVPLVLTPKREKQFPANILNGYRYGEDRYGLPVQYSNLALITNAKLVPTQPTTFAELSATVDQLRKDKKIKRGFLAPQGPGSDGYSMYPLFSGLGGYFFSADSAGALDPANVGLASKPLIKNSSLIDGWNATKLLNSAITADVARSAFVRGKAAFWMAGPEEMETLKSLKFTYRITPVPPILAKRSAVPLLRIQGFMVTKYAEKHGVADVSQKLVGRYLATAGRQLALSAASALNPASTVAAKQVPERRLQAIAAAAVGGVPVPNIPQMTSVWGPYGAAWSTSTSGAGAVPAKDAFTTAQTTVTAALGQ
jgi:arabinogalactan oligomer/maltooligosaccharide transport system substrate-binding protein